MGCADLAIDPRIPAGVMLSAPLLCWDCRGVILLDVKKELGISYEN